MIAALDFVVGIPFQRMVSIVDGADDIQSFEDQIFGDHAGSSLIFEAGHAFIEVHRGPGVSTGAGCSFRSSARECRHDEATLAGHGVPASALDLGLLPVFPHVLIEVVFVE